MTSLVPEAIAVAEVSFTYPVASGHIHALDGVDLEVARGELVCLQGASGSGKSTLLACIAGLEQPESGSITIAGREIVGLRPDELTALRLTTIGLVFQDHNLVAQFTAGENIEIVLRCQQHPQPAQAARELLELVGIPELVDRLPTQMSGGQRQRVGIARALAGDRPFLLCDEPTGSLDSANSVMLFDHLRQIAHERNIGCIVATHDPLARDYGDRTIEMRDGRVA